MYDCDKETICLCYFKKDKLSPVECQSSTIDLKKVPLNVVASKSPNKGGVVLAEDKKIMLQVEGVDISIEKAP